MSYPELIAVLLTALTVFIALLSVVGAIFAFFGYKRLKGEIEKTAKDIAKKSAEKVAKEVAQSTLDNIKMEKERYEWGNPDDEYGDK